MKIPSSKKPLRLIKILVSAAFFSIFALICLLSGSFEGSVVEASAFGPAPGYTGAVDEGNCTACHSSYAVNSGSGNIQISGIPRNYKPGQQIPVTVTVNQSDAVLFGFELTAIDSTGNKAGDLTFPSASPQPLQTVNGFINGILRQYIEHTNQGITPTVFGTKSWQFTWTAPSARVGKISFYAAGNGADSNGSTSGDYIYTTSTSTYTDTNIASFDDDAITDISVYRPS
ncbi:MAG TPA: choice-of-anchor V domain-containing protein, partial [Pyrinomonadaceae bacterium]|nr:choice-of-anchor V domain-containing protein [Pyrinomonadaceae bacterium]